MDYIRNLVGSNNEPPAATEEPTKEPSTNPKKRKKSVYNPERHKKWRCNNKDRIAMYNTKRREKLNALKTCVGYKIKRRSVVPDYAKEYTKPIYERHGVKPDYSLHVPKPRIPKKPKAVPVPPPADSSAPSTVKQKRRRQPNQSEKSSSNKRTKK